MAVTVDQQQLCEALMRTGKVAAAQLERCRRLQAEQYPDRSLTQVLVELGFITVEDLEHARTTLTQTSGSPDPLLGAVIGGCRVLSVLGAGGMATVYLAEEEELGRRVALKMLHPAMAADREYVARLQREARATARLSHPNIVAIHKVGEHQGRPYVVMQHVDGESLKAAILRRGRLSAGEVADLAVALAGALAHAHQAGIVHRDLKPDNVLLDRAGHPYLVDFGIAKVSETTGQLTVTGGLLGTPYYISPEQWEGKPATAQSDLWALGVTLHFALSGALPFAGDTVPEVMRRVMTESPAPLPGDVPREVATLVERLLAKRPQDRPRDGHAAAAAWEEARAGLRTSGRSPAAAGRGRVREAAAPVAAAPAVGPAPRRPGFQGKRKALALTAGALGFVLIVWAVWHFKDKAPRGKYDSDQVKTDGGAEWRLTSEPVDVQHGSDTIVVRFVTGADGYALGFDALVVMPGDEDDAAARVTGADQHQFEEQLLSRVEFLVREHPEAKYLATDYQQGLSPKLQIVLVKAARSQGLEFARLTAVKETGIGVTRPRPETGRAAPSSSPPASSSRPAASVYICPMRKAHPKVFDHPGKCPDCGMTLEPVNNNNEFTKVVGDSRVSVHLWTKGNSPPLLPGFTFVSLNSQGYPEYDKDLGGGVTMRFVLVPAGSFMMGSPNSEALRGSDEGPQHKVTLDAFPIAKYEVTQRRWRAVMGNNPSQFKGDYLPVETVSWNNCQEFCKKVGLSLPSEARWEYACRAGTTTRFSSGDGGSSLGSAGWYDGNAGGKTHAVGGKAANPWGLHDMHGNVWEWCEDTWHTDYRGAPADGSAWVDSGSSFRVNRGGGWVKFSQFCRSADRDGSDPSHRGYVHGFRPSRQLR